LKEGEVDEGVTMVRWEWEISNEGDSAEEEEERCETDMNQSKATIKTNVIFPFLQCIINLRIFPYL